MDGGTIYNQWIIIDWRGHPQFEGYYKWEEPSIIREILWMGCRSIIHGLLWMGNHL